MIDPTELGKSELKRKKEEGKMRYGLSYLFGLLGGFLGGIPFLILFMAFNIKSWPFMIISGAGVYILYLYFIDVSERKKKHVYFLLLSLLSAVIAVMFAFVLINLSKSGAGITFRNIADSYFGNRYSVGGVIDYTLFWHLFALLFAGLGFLGVWLYLKFAVARWEKKNGATRDGMTGFNSRSDSKKAGNGRGNRKNRVSGMK